MLDIETFDNVHGGNTVYKALAHPVAVLHLEHLAERLRQVGPVAVYDPDGIFAPLRALAPEFPVDQVYVHDVVAVGNDRAGFKARAVVDLVESSARTVLIAAFDADRHTARLRDFVPEGTEVVTLDAVRLPDSMLTNRRRYLDPINFATNFVFFRDDDRMGTRLVTANYWSGYGAVQIRIWCRLFDQGGTVIAEFEQQIGGRPGTIVIDSADIRRSHNLMPFTGQLFLHAIGVAGHDVVKYALDTYAHDESGSLSCTHDANAWPSERFAGLPAPRDDERVILWLQNSHAQPIPVGAISLDRMGRERPVSLGEEIPPFATRELDVTELLPDVRWPAQIELRSGRHVVRPRYEVQRAGRMRIAHVNVERADLEADPAIASLSPLLGRGYLLPFPILPRRQFTSVVLPTPMARGQQSLPVRLDIFSPDGVQVAQRFIGNLPRDHACAVDIDDLLAGNLLLDGGHGEMVYDFTDGGEADGWLHGLFRYELRDGSHAAETSFGAHMFNMIMTYRNEPQSYAGPPPGLSTRLFLDLGTREVESFCVLIYPASSSWRSFSETTMILYDRNGTVVAEQRLRIRCSGSEYVSPRSIYRQSDLSRAEGGYVLIRDLTCRLFGYHGKRAKGGAFSLDHMFGF